MSFIITYRFGRFWPVSSTITHRLGVSERFSRLLNPKVRFRVVHQHLPFWPILARLTHRFGVLERFPRLTIPEVRLRVRHQNSQFQPILDCFVGSPFWSPGVISTITDPQGAFTHRFGVPK